MSHKNTLTYILYNFTVGKTCLYPKISFCFSDNTGYDYCMNFEIKLRLVRLGGLTIWDRARD